MKKSNYTMGNRIRDLPGCSAVPQPTATFLTFWHRSFTFNSNKSPIEKLLPQVGNLFALYDDAWTYKP
jgi:hypothetical protein